VGGATAQSGIGARTVAVNQYSDAHTDCDPRRYTQ
jgi:hypothetical protein